MPIFLLGIFKNWKIIGLVGLIVSGFAYRAYLLNQIEDKTTEIRNKEVEIVTLISTKNQLMKTINDRNAEISRWKDVSIKLEENQAKLSSKIGEIKRATASEVNKILEEDSKPENCEAAIEYMVEGARGLKW